MIKKYTYKKNNYRSLIKVILPSLLFLIVLFSLFSLSNNKTIINNLSKVFYGDNEVELDNWEISTVFYDSTVNDGKTPLTEINWDASDGGYGQGEARTITVQINYKNTNTVTSYEPGELEITIDNLGYNFDSGSWRNVSYLYATQIVAGANDSTHTNYDWNFKSRKFNGYTYNSPTYYLDMFSFSNAKTIEQHTNFEGSIQIEYTIVPISETFPYQEDALYDEEGHRLSYQFLDSCTHDYEKNIKATLNENITSNKIHFTYHRTYIHLWQKATYTLTKTPSKILSYDGLGENPSDYIWVKYTFEIHENVPYDSSRITYPYLTVQDYTIKDAFPEGCRVFDNNLNELTAENGFFQLNKSWHQYMRYSNYDESKISAYVGYPKSIYNEENGNLSITNHAEIWGAYDNSTEKSLLADDSVSINLDDYEFSYNGELYSITKKIIGSSSNKKLNEPNSKYNYYSSPGKLYYQALNGSDDQVGSGGLFNNLLYLNTVLVGNSMDIKFGDDLLFISNQSGDYKKLDDSEYYFTTITFPYYLYNGNNVLIKDSKYDCELWVRKGNDTSYVKYADFKNVNASYKTWNFTEEDDVNAYYFIIKNVKEGIKSSYHYSTYSSLNKTSSTIRINSVEDIPDSGRIYNLSYIQIYVDGVLQNESSIDSYDNSSIGLAAAEYDMQTYNHYLQRDLDYIEYEPYQIPSVKNLLTIEKEMSKFTQDAENKEFTGTATLKLGTWYGTIQNTTEDNLLKYYSTIDQSSLVKGYEVYDLLPLGMDLMSNESQIIQTLHNSLSFRKGYRIMDLSGKVYTDSEWANYLQNHSTVTIIKNFRNTNRTYISVVFDSSDNPLIVFRDSSQTYSNFNIMSIQYNYRVTYDSYLEYGNTYTNRVYARYHGNEFDDNAFSYMYYYTPRDDDGRNDSQEYDINIDGSTRDKIINRSKSATITSVISTNQDLQVSVKSGDNYFETGKVNVPNLDEYEYKLRARTGTNDVTNLVIYDSLENYAKDTNMEFIDSAKGYHKWKGEFLGIDTSYAESKGYNIRTYYSEKEKPGNLKEDDSWNLYTDSVDKTKVKSLAFEYLDGEGNPAVLPANSLTYVLVKMKSPSDENIKTLAYNGCWTEWNAIDSITGRPVDFITGINSNIVKVALPNSVEPQDIDLEINKYWNDSNNKLNIRPDTTTIQVVPDGDLSKAIDVPLGTTNVDPNNSNHWKTTISVPKYDLDGNTINYTFRENEIVLDNNYKYTPEVNDNSITNTLNKEIELKKIWKDNTNSYLTRPSNVTYHIKQNNNSYKDITFTGDYSTNEWTKTITVPVFDNINKEYTYTMEEESINNYISDCNEFTCTNTLSANDTLNIKKNWLDNNNSYNTRPNSIMINILQNNNTYRGITLTSNNNWAHTITVPKYDSNGVKYNYTIEEEQVNEYGLVEYNQSNYTVTNTLKTNINLTITKNWIDDNNSNNTRPNELKITLLQNNNEYRELTLSGDTNTWTTTIEVPKYDNNQKEYKYSIREITDNLNSDYSDITYSEEELSVTNKLNKKQDLLIKKKWMDDDNKYLTRPSSVIVNLLRDNELFKTIELEGDSNIWSTTINDIDIYDSNGRKYNYTLEEETLEKYGKVTYNNADLEITNELTEIPKVTLYFTVVNGYVDPVTGEMKYDDFGLNEIMKKYNVDPDSEYIFEFELQNTSTNKIYNGKLSTQGILEFDDIPYGEYKAVEGKDKLFTFVDMLEIEEVHGVKFEKKGNEGYITIEPTGENIVYGAKIINKIEAPITNPKTHIKGLFLVFTIILISVFSFIIIRKKKELYN